MKEMTSSRASEITKMIFIDSTWAQAKHIFKDPRLQGNFRPKWIKGLTLPECLADNDWILHPWQKSAVIQRDRILRTAKQYSPTSLFAGRY